MEREFTPFLTFITHGLFVRVTVYLDNASRTQLYFLNRPFLSIWEFCGRIIKSFYLELLFLYNAVIYIHNCTVMACTVICQHIHGYFLVVLTLTVSRKKIICMAFITDGIEYCTFLFYPSL